MIFKIGLGPKQALFQLVKVKCCLMIEKLQERDLKADNLGGISATKVCNYLPKGLTDETITFLP